METVICHALGPNPFLGLDYEEQNFNLRKYEYEIGCLEGAYFPNQRVFVVSGIEISEEHRGNNYSLKLLRHMSDSYQNPTVLLYNVRPEDKSFWTHVFKKKVIQLNHIKDVPIEKIRILIKNEN